MAIVTKDQLKFESQPKKEEPDLTLDQKDIEFILETFESAMCPMNKLKQALITVGKLQGTYKRLTSK